IQYVGGREIGIALSYRINLKNVKFCDKKITFILKLPSALEPPHLSDDLTAKRMMLMALREGYSILSYVKSLLVFQPV
ncbi:TPA: hypothetical protein ACH902_005458, partial [Escherichia coli]